MATKQSTAKKKMDKQTLIAAFMDQVLEDTPPKSVYAFCKTLKIEETTFYGFFGSLEALQKGVWEGFYEYVEGLLAKDENYENYPKREKLLAFFYTFFELLTANRSYVLLQLGTESMGADTKMPWKQLRQFKGLRTQVLHFAQKLKTEQDTGEVSKIKEKFTEQTAKLFTESVWMQFLFLLKFWKDDTSANFEKTDVAIEKSVQTLFDVVDHSPVERLLDFGKFLWNERKS